MLDALGNPIVFGNTYSVSIADVGSGPESVSICQGVAIKVTPAGKVTLGLSQITSVYNGDRISHKPEKKTQSSYWAGMLYPVRLEI
jgi:archaellum component FlaF (FlaF/FlaG flagellin family)